MTTDSDTANDGAVSRDGWSALQLIELGTYQGLTDTEINSIIDYKVAQAVTNANAEVRYHAFETEFARYADKLVEESVRARRAMEKLFDKELELVTEIEEVTEIG